MIGTSEEIARVGTKLVNSERENGELITKVMEEVSKEGIIITFDGKTLYSKGR